MIIPTFNTHQELFKFLKENKSLLVAEKKSTMKKADSCSLQTTVEDSEGTVIKAADLTDNIDLEEIKVSVVINTTNILDSHGDVHMKGIWNKSLKENKNLFLLQEHQMKFDRIISDSKNDMLVASAPVKTWKELGIPKFPGTTEALIFDTSIKSDRNEFMFEQYLKGYVNNHSVGMQYVQMFLCINSEEKYYKEEKANWDKYITEVANAKDAEKLGYFWAVTEAKIVEGSAVVIGSNQATPTLSVTTTQNIEADKTTSTQEPLKSTQQGLDYKFLLNNLKQKNN